MFVSNGDKYTIWKLWGQVNLMNLSLRLQKENNENINNWFHYVVAQKLCESWRHKVTVFQTFFMVDISISSRRGIKNSF